nr:uncharacterized protein LOC113823840 [Penaeus vannamei]
MGVEECGGEEQQEVVLNIPGLRYKTVLYSPTIKTSSDGRVMWVNCNMTLSDSPNGLKDSRRWWILSLAVSLLSVTVIGYFAWLVVRHHRGGQGKRVFSLAYSQLQGEAEVD